ncbi:unnamed protein product [Lepeophtheirus salmonis]|uniref:(salmon louse) hypothetical protein n=1 Tax=Lepeophtheirus salmonis TaxID=72036 RepID=A0A7R8CJA5_LEPSM|nr:unnamed protein product [Lepeophtheirus salmonis]CAF2838700.1 unnamed protein product [Lepeophtheirus salmonis]
MGEFVFPETLNRMSTFASSNFLGQQQKDSSYGFLDLNSSSSKGFLGFIKNKYSSNKSDGSGNLRVDKVWQEHSMNDKRLYSHNEIMELEGCLYSLLPPPWNASSQVINEESLDVTMKRLENIEKFSRNDHKKYFDWRQNFMASIGIAPCPIIYKGSGFVQLTSRRFEIKDWKDEEPDIIWTENSSEGVKHGKVARGSITWSVHEATAECGNN